LMTYRLCIVNEENWNLVGEKSLCGVPEKQTQSGFQLLDKVFKV